MAINNFEACHAHTAKWEGGWSDHSADPGGKTNWGITQATLGVYLGRPASAAEIRALTKEQAKLIYKKLFWNSIGAETMPRGVDMACYDWGVNSGPARGKKAFNDTAGILSPPARVKQIMASRRAFFAAIIARNGKLAAFRKGWANRAAGIEAAAYKMALTAQGMQPEVIAKQMQAEASQAGKTAAKKTKQATTAGSGAAVGGAATAASGWNWEMIAFGGVCVAIVGFVAFLAWRAVQAEKARAEAFKETANG